MRSRSGVVRRGTSQDPADNVVLREAFCRMAVLCYGSLEVRDVGSRAPRSKATSRVSIGFSRNCEFGLSAGCLLTEYGDDGRKRICCVDISGKMYIEGQSSKPV